MFKTDRDLSSMVISGETSHIGVVQYRNVYIGKVYNSAHFSIETYKYEVQSTRLPWGKSLQSFKSN